MNERDRIINTIEFKQRNGMDITNELNQAIIYCLKQCDSIPLPPKIYLPLECTTGTALDRIQAKFKYWVKQFEFYCITDDQCQKMIQLDYLSSIILGTFPDIDEYYFKICNGSVIAAGDPRYKPDLFIQYGSNEKAFIQGMQELNQDVSKALTGKPVDLYIALSNIMAFIMHAYMQLYDANVSQK